MEKDIELLGWISPDMSDEEVLAMIDEVEAEDERERDACEFVKNLNLFEEEAREELSDFAMNSRD